MKNSILSLGTILNKEMQKQINGGDCIVEDHYNKVSYMLSRPCDPNNIFEREG